MNYEAIILCNHRLAIPSLRELAFFGKLGRVIIPAHNRELASELEMLAELKGKICEVTRTNLAEQLTQATRESRSSVCLVMSFPFRLTKEMLSLFPGRFFNFHFGTLPRYRGPEPVFAQLKNGELQAAVSVHHVTEQLDGGPVCMEERIRIHDSDTYGTLQTRLAHTSATMAGQLLKLLDFGSAVPGREQDENEAGWAARPGMEQVFINWDKMTAVEIRNLVRACNPWNKGAGTKIGQMIFGILEVEILAEERPRNFTAGTIVSLNSGGLKIATKDHKLLKVNVIYCPEGFMSGQGLALFGFREKDRFM